MRVLFEFWPRIVPIQNLMHLNQHGIQMALQMLGFYYKIIPNPRHRLKLYLFKLNEIPFNPNDKEISFLNMVVKLKLYTKLFQA